MGWFSLLFAMMAVTPHTSHASLSVSNGYSAGVVQSDTGALTILMPHPYAEETPGAMTPDLAYDVYAGLSIDGQGGTWLGKEEPEFVDYEPATGLIRVVHRMDDVKVETFFFTPWELELPSLAVVIRVTNEGQDTRSVVLAGLANLHLGDDGQGPSPVGEHMERVDATHYEESGAGEWSAVYRVTPTPTTWAGTSTNPFGRFESVGDLPFDDPSTGSGDDRVLGVARGPLPLDPWESASMSLVVGLQHEMSLAPVASIVDGWIAGRSPDALVDDERSAWQDRLASDTFIAPQFDEIAVWRQGLALMLMAQVREPHVDDKRPTGQILASLPPGIWNRTWPRDMSYAIAALSRTGFEDAAFDALSFVLSATAGGYTEQVGGDYLVSVARYLGDGTEESDGDPATQGPNIEFDGFGLFLWALGAWANGQDDLSPLDEHWPTIREKVADVIVGLVEPETGLMAADSSIWEVHWNGREKHFTYTNAAAVAGLCAASRLAERYGDLVAAQAYGDVAETIRQGVLTHLVDPTTGGLAGNLEEMEDGTALDAAAVEAINWGLVAPDSEIAQQTMASFDALRLDSDRGYARNDDGDWYDSQEWVFVNLRIAAALRRMGQIPQAEGLTAWVVAQSRANFDMIAELYTEDGADYEGAVPMTGYGAGALALARLDAHPPMNAEGCVSWDEFLNPPPPPIPEPEPEPEPEPDAGEASELDAGDSLASDTVGSSWDGSPGEIPLVGDVGTSGEGAREHSSCASATRRNRAGGGWEWSLLVLLAIVFLRSLRACPREKGSLNSLTSLRGLTSVLHRSWEQRSEATGGRRCIKSHMAKMSTRSTHAHRPSRRPVRSLQSTAVLSRSLTTKSVSE